MKLLIYSLSILLSLVCVSSVFSGPVPQNVKTVLLDGLEPVAEVGKGDVIRFVDPKGGGEGYTPGCLTYDNKFFAIWDMDESDAQDEIKPDEPKPADGLVISTLVAIKYGDTEVGYHMAKKYLSRKITIK